MYIFLSRFSDEELENNKIFLVILCFLNFKTGVYSTKYGMGEFGGKIYASVGKYLFGPIFQYFGSILTHKC